MYKIREVYLQKEVYAHEDVDEFLVLRSRKWNNFIEQEVNEYFEDPNALFNKLNYYPNVKRVFIKHNTNYLCSSAPVERLFSLTGST